MRCEGIVILSCIIKKEGGFTDIRPSRLAVLTLTSTAHSVPSRVHSLYLRKSGAEGTGPD